MIVFYFFLIFGSKIDFMGEVVLTREEREIKEWAGKSFREPWFTLVERCAKLKNGEKLSEEEKLFHPFFIDILIDTELIYKTMKTLKISRFVSGNLFTIILSKKEDRVIWACVEREEDGVFVSAKVLDPTQKWADKIAELLFIDNLKGAYEFLSDWVKRNEIAESIGAIKVANIMFFKTIKDAWEKSSEGKNLPLFLILLLDAVKTNIEKRWIRFYPDVPLAKIISLSYPLLKHTVKLVKPASYLLSVKYIDSLLKAYYSYLLPAKIEV